MAFLGAASSHAQDADDLSVGIPGQPLTEALAAYARQTGLQLVYVSKLAQGKSSPGAPAGLAPRAALTRLLEGTGLQFEFLNERSVRIFAARSPPKGTLKQEPSPLPRTTAEQEEVVVTAQAREESADRVPVTISVWTAEAMNLAGITRLDNLADQTAGAYFMRAARGGGGISTALVLRGLNGLPGNATTGVYIDDVPIHAHGNGQSTSWGDFAPLTFDMDRVEVLYGPQGVLGGDSAEAGAVRYITRQPSLTNWSGFATSEAATTQHGAPSYELGAAYGGPIVPEVAGFRATLWWRSDGGYIDRVDPFNGVVLDANANHTSSSVGRLAVTLAPTDDVRITPSFIRQAEDVHDSPAFYDYLSNPGARILLNGKLLRQPSDDTFYLGSLMATVDFPRFQLTSITAYANRTMFTVDDMTNALGPVVGGWGNPLGFWYPTSYLDAVPATLNDKQTQLSQELRLASSDPNAQLTWLFGTWLSHAIEDESNLTSPVDPSLADTLSGYSWTSAATIQTDVFGQIDVRIANRLRGSAGVRISHTQFETSGIQRGPLNSGAAPSFNVSSSATPVAPRFGLTYTPEDYGVLYLTVAKGYRLGGVNQPPFSVCDQPYSATYSGDYMWSYEAGAKTRSPGGALQIDAAVFHLAFHDVLQFAVSNCGQFYLVNVGTAASDGFDLALRYQPLDRLQLGTTIEYADARYTESVRLPPGGYSITEGDAVGVAPHVAPPWSGTAWLNTLVLATQRPEASVRVSAVFHSHNPGPFNTSNPADGNYAPGWRSDPATTRVSLRAQLSWPSFELSAFVYNVLGAQPVLGRISDDRQSTLYYDETFRPRTFGVAASRRF